MRASDFRQPPRRDFPVWVRCGSYVPLLAIGVPVAKILELADVWPRTLCRKIQAAASKSAFGGYQPSRRDVFACVGFKSGTTWLLQIAVQIACLGDAEFDNIHSVVPWPDAPLPFQRRIIPLTDDSPVCRSPVGLRVIKTHQQQMQVPYSPDARYIVMVRDPKDAIVSSYHFVRSLILGPLMPTVRRWVDICLDGDLPQGSWAEHLAGYWQLRTRPNVLFLTYEQLSVDPPGVIREIARFMGVELAPAQFDAVVNASSFEEMRRRIERFEPGRIVPWSKHGSMLRSGKVGRSAELLSPNLRRKIDERCRAELERLNCDFPYESAFGLG